MKIKQTPQFQPITITLETVEEAEALWGAICMDGVVNEVPERKIILDDLSNWFSNNAQLGG
jgi:hypothetical protein